MLRGRLCSRGAGSRVPRADGPVRSSSERCPYTACRTVDCVRTFCDGALMDSFPHRQPRPGGRSADRRPGVSGADCRAVQLAAAPAVDDSHVRNRRIPSGPGPARHDRAPGEPRCRGTCSLRRACGLRRAGRHVETDPVAAPDRPWSADGGSAQPALGSRALAADGRLRTADRTPWQLSRSAARLRPARWRVRRSAAGST